MSIGENCRPNARLLFFSICRSTKKTTMDLVRWIYRLTFYVNDFSMSQNGAPEREPLQVLGIRYQVFSYQVVKVSSIRYYKFGMLFMSPIFANFPIFYQPPNGNHPSRPPGPDLRPRLQRHRFPNKFLATNKFTHLVT